MRKTICLSIASIAVLQGAEQLEAISVNEKIDTKIVENVSGAEVKSADLADALNKNVPSISLIRRSGIANDIILRGQKRDNINITIDGAKICGACVNRMDPPTSHVVTHAIENVEVREGPFDIEEFGVLSGSVKVTTKKPTKKLTGELGINAGSFGYKKLSGTVSGGSDKVRMLFSASAEESKQYEDGNGNNFAEQLTNYTSRTISTTDDGFNYSNADRNRDSFDKKMVMGKVFIDIADEQELRLSYTANRSTDVLYPSSKMDALSDDSDIFNVEYTAKNLSSYSTQFDIQVYNSKVDHPMSTKYRALANTSGNYMTHHLTTDMKGLKVKNKLNAFGGEVTYGVDTSKRNWDGVFTVTSLTNAFPVRNIGTSIADVDTKNMGLFIKSKKTIGKVDVEFGARYDDTSIDTKSSTERDNDYEALSANVFATYKADDETKFFAGIGKSSRVPDARELYNARYKLETGKVPIRVVNGNPNLDQTTNYELDVGVEKQYDNGSIKVKTFYSKLKDYIYYNGNPAIKSNNFENIDATIYGAELSGVYFVSDTVTLDAGFSYKRGKKDTQTTGQTNKNLAEITPMKLNTTLSYDYDSQGSVELSAIASDKWSNVDSENGEQKLAGYGVFNLKTTREFDNGFVITAGVDNLTDKTYTTTNTYKDLILMTDGTDTMLINEPGRYIYLNAKYQF